MGKDRLRLTGCRMWLGQLSLPFEKGGHMAVNLRGRPGAQLGGQIACLILWPVLSLAQSSDLEQNLAACKSGHEICDQSKLSPSQTAELDATNRERNVSDCRNGFDSCDHSKLTQPQVIALAVADHQRNLTDCKDGMASCDPSRLTQSEARESSVAAHQRNLADCTDGVSDCDRSKLSPSEASAVDAT